MGELFPSQLHPPPTLFPNAIVLFLKSSFVLIVFASSWQLTHLSPTVPKKMSWSCSPKHSPDVSAELKHISNDSFHLGVKLFGNDDHLTAQIADAVTGEEEIQRHFIPSTRMFIG